VYPALQLNRWWRSRGYRFPTLTVQTPARQFERYDTNCVPQCSIIILRVGCDKYGVFPAALVDTSSTMDNGHEKFVIPVR
jgi:hypothetical protein